MLVPRGLADEAFEMPVLHPEPEIEDAEWWIRVVPVVVGSARSASGLVAG